MEIIGKIKVLCDLVQGETEAGPWCKRDVVVTTVGDEPHDVAVTFFGERKVNKLSELKTGDMVQVIATVKSRANGDRWFTTVDASSIAVLQRQPVQTEANSGGEPPY